MDNPPTPPSLQPNPSKPINKIALLIAFIFVFALGTELGFLIGVNQVKTKSTQPINKNIESQINETITPSQLTSITITQSPKIATPSATVKTPDSNNNSNLPHINGCQIFPADNSWNWDVSQFPLLPQSAQYITSIGSSKGIHPDFGGASSGNSWGIPYTVVPKSQPAIPIHFTAYGSESDPGPYPIPNNAAIEGGSSSTGDRHVLVINSDTCKLYELYRGFPTAAGWDADSGAVFDLTSNKLRPERWTSADAAGLPIFPGLIKYEEVKNGSVNHAIRFTVQKTQRAYIHPATHFASSSTDANLPPMGLRLRLKANFDISKLKPQAKIIATAMKKYGMILADNGGDWFFQGDVNQNWDDADINELKSIPGSAFEAVDTGALIK
jgi:hypothetical protein